MDVTYRLDKDIVYIAIEGRIDASNAAEAEKKIFSIKDENPGKHALSGVLHCSDGYFIRASD